MPAIDFPNSPTLNQEFTAGGTIYIWDGAVWKVKSSAQPPSSSIVSYSANAPANPVTGQVWVESDVNVNTIDTTTLYTKTEVDNALGLKANLASPALSGTPTAPTANAGTNTTQIATTAFVNTSITNLINGAPGALDTLDELAAALGDDSNFATTVTNSLALKANLASPTLTGTPAAPTAAVGTDTTQIATTAFVNAEISNDAIVKTVVNAKGDLVTATANDTPAILSVGSNGQILMADSGATLGLRYVDPPANRNLIINGAMQVHQRATSVASLAFPFSGYVTADRWRLGLPIGTWTQTIENDAPAGSGLRKSLKMLCTTANASPAAGDVLRIDTRFEGQDLQHIRKGTASAQQLTLSFWVKSNVTGTYIVDLVDVDNTRQVGSSYTISQSGTWERKVITFPADTTGEFDNDNALSLLCVFWQGAGSDFTSGTLQTTWGATVNANRAVGQVNLAAATNNYWQITGVQLETGPVATPFGFEPYETTLRKCQRYYYRLEPGAASRVLGTGQAAGTGSALVYVPFPTTLRTRPSALEQSGTASHYGLLNNVSSLVASNSVPAYDGGTTADMAVLFGYVNNAVVAGDATALFTNNSAAYLAWSAEL